MRLADLLVEEIDLETPLTRRALERVPEDQFAWKPHDRSMTLGWLATFSANVFEWGVDAAERESFDVLAARGSEPPRQPAASRAALLELFDRKVKACRSAIAGVSDERLLQPWTLLAAGKEIWSRPRWLVIRTYVLNHAVHHRGQLTVYLRLLGIPVPAIYNDSADERGGMFNENLAVR